MVYREQGKEYGHPGRTCLLQHFSNKKTSTVHFFLSYDE